jgi:non-ribosomal peptide synthetase component E (peptide arylation enzyme)
MSEATPVRLRHSVHYPEILFPGLLERAADQYGEALALLFDEVRFTFRELEGLANSFASTSRIRRRGSWRPLESRSRGRAPYS